MSHSPFLGSLLGKAKDTLVDIGHTVKNTAQGAIDRTKSALNRGKNIVTNTVSRRIDTARRVASTVKDTASKAIDKTKDIVKDVGRRAKHVAKTVVRKTKKVIRKAGDVIKHVYNTVRNNIELGIKGIKEKVKQGVRSGLEVLDGVVGALPSILRGAIRFLLAMIKNAIETFTVDPGAFAEEYVDFMTKLNRAVGP